MMLKGHGWYAKIVRSINLGIYLFYSVKRLISMSSGENEHTGLKCKTKFYIMYQTIKLNFGNLLEGIIYNRQKGIPVEVLDQNGNHVIKDSNTFLINGKLYSLDSYIQAMINDLFSITLTLCRA